MRPLLLAFVVTMSGVAGWLAGGALINRTARVRGAAVQRPKPRTIPVKGTMDAYLETSRYAHFVKEIERMGKNGEIPEACSISVWMSHGKANIMFLGTCD